MKTDLRLSNLALSLEWGPLRIDVIHDDIRRSVAWRTCVSVHRVLVHLQGGMHRLETELEGHGGSLGAALPGECWTIPAARTYSSALTGPEVIRYAILSLSPGPSGSQGGEADLLARAAYRDPFLHAGLERLLPLMTRQDDLSRMQEQGLGASLVGHLQQHYLEGGGGKRKPAPVYPVLTAGKLRRLRAYVLDQLSDSLVLDDMALVAGMTTHHFLRAFREAFGMTPWQYVIGQRLRCAQRLLRETRHDIGTIALMSGFSSHSHLTSVFRKHIGCAPRDYRGLS